ncbi:unnamed protein product [Candidula unifasciata]|uniref:Phospholipid/glycerol acyltransferase domain-containing protein n=1 Tax=Candidula unifasciata TaxID=100452 RepID=A0A8S4A8C3_9EUPU|nr:unnamed protein product [Candidula unifasciata]
MYNWIRCTLKTIFFIASNIYALPCYMVWMTLLTPLRFLAPSVYWRIEAFMFRMLQCMVVTWLDPAGYKVLECGDDIRLLQDEAAIILCNHQSTADTPIVMLASYNKGMAAGNTMWIMFILFKYTNFGLISWHREDFFIDQGREVRNLQLEKLREHLIQSYLPHKRKWIIVFPEGGFLHKRLESSQKYAKKYGFPVLKHTTLPRIGAMKTILDTVGEPYTGSEDSKTLPSPNCKDDHQIEDSSRPLKWIIDITLAYKDGQPLDMLGMCLGICPQKDILLHYRAYRAKDIPRDEAGLTRWLYDRYEDKERVLDYYYKYGQLPEDVLNKQHLLPQMNMSYLKFDIIQQILIHTFCLVSCYVHYIFILKPVMAVVYYFLSFIF